MSYIDKYEFSNVIHINMNILYILFIISELFIGVHHAIQKHNRQLIKFAKNFFVNKLTLKKFISLP